MLKIEHLNKKFGKKEVLKDVSLTLSPGERIHIIGKNGSGKSTIFKIITGILKQNGGTVEIGTDDVIGALIENPSFLEYESGLENLKFLAELNHNYDEKLVKDLMEEFSIETAIVVCEIYRHGNDWKFNAVGSGYQGGLEALCRSFGINV